MTLDALTLMAAGSFAAAVSAILLTVAWTQIRSPALIWWASAAALNAVGIVLLITGVQAGGTAIILSAAANALSPIAVWTGARAFNQRGPYWPVAAIGPFVFIASGTAAAFGAPENVAIVPGFALWSFYLGAAAYELWRGRSERLAARVPLIGFMLLHALVFLSGSIEIITGAMATSGRPDFGTWFSAIHFETLIYLIGTSVLMVLMCKQRSEQAHIAAARHDSMTGIVNRGAFLEVSERLLQRGCKEGLASALVLFDLDHFKWINDTYGHAAGDDVIRAFTDTARNVLRPNDVFGRYGGEEFAVMLPCATSEVAYAIAERIRHNFEERQLVVDGRTVSATVSAGIASVGPEDATMPTLMRRADRNLYRAKNLGRNRVEGDEPSRAKIVRIA